MKRGTVFACIAGTTLLAPCAHAYFGVLRIDSIHYIDPGNPETSHNTAFDGKWWFQPNGTGDFSSGSLVTGTFTDWIESGPTMIVGDGSNHVSMWWSICGVHSGWFYGSLYPQVKDSDVAFAPNVTDISQITDAAGLSYTNLAIGPQYDADHNGGVGDFIVWESKPVPEPATLLVLGAGLALVANRRRRS